MRKFTSFLASSVFVGGSAFIAYDYEQKTLPTETEEKLKKTVSEKTLPINDEKPAFETITSIDEKKSKFFNYLSPGIAIENERILKERQRLEDIQSRFESRNSTDDDLSYAKRLGKLYNLNVPAAGITQSWVTTMLHRVDVLPAALALTQAANESAWGTSRFATEANNYFGQWCYSKGCGLVPLQRSEGMSHEVAKFSSVQQSIHGYFMNVNRNAAYKELREIRFQRHKANQDLLTSETATALTNGLLRYSERGQDYVNDLQAMIRHNKKYWEK